MNSTSIGLFVKDPREWVWFLINQKVSDKEVAVNVVVTRDYWNLYQLSFSRRIYIKICFNGE